MVTRKSTIPATPFVETVHPESAAPEPFTMPKIDWAYLIKSEASWKRWGLAMLAGLATSIGIGYVGGYIVAYMTIAAALVSSSLFITMVAYFIGLLLVMYASYRASMYAYLKVIDKF